MQVLVFSVSLLICLSSLSQGVYMPSNAPGLSPIRGVNVNQGGLSGTGLKYNDGSYVNEKDADIKGSPFLYNDWYKSNVLLKTKDRIDSIMVKYNVYADQLQVKVDDKEYEFNIDVWEFLLPDPTTGKTALFRSGVMPEAGTSDKSFYQVLYDGKTKYLLKYKKIIGTEPTSIPGVKSKVYEDQKTYYILTASGRMEKIRKRNKSILDLLEGETAGVKAMVEDKKMKLSNDDEIIRALEFYDNPSNQKQGL